jgi:hypothetical protein
MAYAGVREAMALIQPEFHGQLFGKQPDSL